MRNIKFQIRVRKGGFETSQEAEAFSRQTSDKLNDSNLYLLGKVEMTFNPQERSTVRVDGKFVGQCELTLWGKTELSQKSMSAILNSIVDEHQPNVTYVVVDAGSHELR